MLCCSTNAVPVTVWTCDCELSSSISDALLLVSVCGSWARIADELATKQPSCCLHVIAAPLLLQRMTSSSQQSLAAHPALILKRQPVLASVEFEKNPIHRVFVSESTRHRLRCSNCGSRTFLCAHAITCARALGATEQTRLGIDLDPNRSVKQRLAPVTVDSKQLTLAFDSVSLPNPLKPTGPVLPRTLRPTALCCQHSAACLTDCKCAVPLETVPDGQVHLFDVNGRVVLQLLKSHCANCGHLQSCTVEDAHGAGIFVTNDGHYLTFNLLMRYDLALARAGMTFDAFWKAQCDFLRPQSVTFIAKPSFIDSWWQWNRSRAMDFDNAFTCSACEGLPMSERVFVLDVTQMGFKRDKFYTDECKTCADRTRPVVCGRWGHFD
jgi:hypothetical protein